jgi:acyl carrier protein
MAADMGETREAILETVNAVFRDVLDNEGIVLTDKTTAKEVAEWDSLSHIQLVVAVEKRFQIRFSSREIQNWNNIGEMIDSIVAKLK